MEFSFSFNIQLQYSRYQAFRVTKMIDTYLLATIEQEKMKNCSVLFFVFCSLFCFVRSTMSSPPNTGHHAI